MCLSCASYSSILRISDILLTWFVCGCGCADHVTVKWFVSICSNYQICTTMPKTTWKSSTNRKIRWVYGFIICTYLLARRHEAFLFLLLSSSFTQIFHSLITIPIIVVLDGQTAGAPVEQLVDNCVCIGHCVCVIFIDLCCDSNISKTSFLSQELEYFYYLT
jgi:hypothetical protein